MTRITRASTISPNIADMKAAMSRIAMSKFANCLVRVLKGETRFSRNI